MAERKSDMSEFLDVRVGDIKNPETLPSGLFKLVMLRYQLLAEKNEKKTKFVLATFKPVEVVSADEDVNLEDTEVKNVQVKFYRTPKADPMTLRFLTETLGITATPDDILGTLWEQAVGREVVAEIKRQFAEKSKKPYVTVERWLKAD